MKIIAFGASGFVGSHVADALTAAGHDVTIFDASPSKYLQEKQSYIEGDILDYEAVIQAIDGHDVVYNFAGISDIDEALNKPSETVRINIQGCIHQLEAAKECGIKRFVFASTIYVYSESGGFYRVSKQACELYIEEYQRLYGLDYTILRYGTLYGRRADARNSIYRHLRQALFERKIVAQGTSNTMREYIHVEDAARSSVDILDDEYRNQNIILTGHAAYKSKDMLEMIREIVGSDVVIDYRDPEEDRGHGHGHYNLTPYAFRPKIGRKLVSNYFTDMGQGLLDCLNEIHDNEMRNKSL